MPPHGPYITPKGHKSEVQSCPVLAWAPLQGPGPKARSGGSGAGGGLRPEGGGLDWHWTGPWSQGWG